MPNEEFWNATLIEGGELEQLFEEQGQQYHVLRDFLEQQINAVADSEIQMRLRENLNAAEQGRTLQNWFNRWSGFSMANQLDYQDLAYYLGRVLSGRVQRNLPTVNQVLG